MTSPLTTFPAVRASNACVSESKARAVPRNSSDFAPAIFITEPSGASEPYKIAVPPSGWIASFIA